MTATQNKIRTQAQFIVDNNATVREAAEALGVSKSTIHKNMTERLKYIDGPLYREVKEILKRNKAERHMRGGLATREKFRKIKETKK